MVYQRSITVGALCSACVGVFAAPAQDHFTAAVNMENFFTDNALKTSTGEIDERQDTLGVRLQGQNTNRYSSFNLSYSADRTYFSEHSQEDTNTLVGDAGLVLGKEYDWFNLTLQESRRKVLNSGAATPLLSNTGERELLTVNPQLRLHFSSVDQFLIGASREYVQIKRAVGADAIRDTANLIWQHDISATDQMMCSYVQGESTRDSSIEADYKYQIAHLGYQARLSHLIYNVQLGYQQTQTKGQPDSGTPNYQVDFKYTKNGHVLGVAASSQVSDTLFGDGNSNSLENALVQDSLSQVFDTVKITQASVNWASPALWRGIHLGAQAQFASHDYSALPQDYTDLGASLTVAYAMSAHSRVALNIGRNEAKFDQQLLNSDFQEDNLLVRFSRNFTRNFNADLSVGTIQRHSDAVLNQYTEQRVGLSLRYQF